MMFPSGCELPMHYVLNTQQEILYPGYNVPFRWCERALGFRDKMEVNIKRTANIDLEVI